MRRGSVSQSGPLVPATMHTWNNRKEGRRKRKNSWDEVAGKVARCCITCGTPECEEHVLVHETAVGLLCLD